MQRRWKVRLSELQSEDQTLEHVTELMMNNDDWEEEHPDEEPPATHEDMVEILLLGIWREVHGARQVLIDILEKIEEATGWKQEN